MSDLDLRERIRRESQGLPGPSFTLDDVQRTGRRRRRVRHLGAGAGLVAAAALVFAGFVVLPGQGSGPEPVASPEATSIEWDLAVGLTDGADPEAVLADVRALPEVAEAEYVADYFDVFPLEADPAAAPAAVPTSAPVVTSDTGEVYAPAGTPAPGLVLLRLNPGSDVGATVERLERLPSVGRAIMSTALAHDRLAQFFTDARVGSQVFEGDPVILQPPEVPLAFDPGGLGEEAPLRDLVERTELPAFIVDRPPDPDVLRDRQRRDARYPLIHVGSLADGRRLILYGAVGGDLCEAEVHVDGSGTGCGALAFEPEYGVSGWSSQEGPDRTIGSVTVRVPEATAVVVVIRGDVVRWQRPRLGWALIPYEGSADLGIVEVVALASDGTELGRWRGGP